MYSAIVAFCWAPLLTPSHRPPVSYGLFSVKMDTSLFLMAVLRWDPQQRCTVMQMPGARPDGGTERGKKKWIRTHGEGGSSVSGGRALGQWVQPRRLFDSCITPVTSAAKYKERRKQR